MPKLTQTSKADNVIHSKPSCDFCYSLKAKVLNENRVKNHIGDGDDEILPEQRIQIFHYHIRNCAMLIGAAALIRIIQQIYTNR